MPASVLNHQKKAEHMEAALPMKDKETVALSEVERDSKEKVVMAAKVTAIMAVAKDTAIMVVAKDTAIMAAAKDTAIMVVAKVADIMEVAKGMAITMVVISDSIVAHPIAIGTTC